MANKSYTYVYKPIKRNRDDQGRILTYTVEYKLPNELKHDFEFNSLKQARRFAINGFKDKKTGKIEKV